MLETMIKMLTPFLLYLIVALIAWPLLLSIHLSAPTFAQEQEQQQQHCSSTTTSSLEDDSPSLREPWEPLSLSERGFAFEVLNKRLMSQVDRSTTKFEIKRQTIELHEPNKLDTIAYLEQRKSNNNFIIRPPPPPPTRYARMICNFEQQLFNQSTNVTSIRQYLVFYKVGPLLDCIATRTCIYDDSIKVEALSKEIPRQGPTSQQQQVAMSEFVNHPTIRDFLERAFPVADNTTTGSYGYSEHPSGLYRNNSTGLHMAWRRTFWYLDNILSHPLPLAGQIQFVPNINHPEGGVWKFGDILYGTQFYLTAEQFISSIEAGTVQMVPVKPFVPQPTWQTFDRRTAGVRSECCQTTNLQSAPATNIEPRLRYTVTPNNRVSWMGWNFHVSNRPRTGMALHDISFGGERIVYELSLQELQAKYTGYMPHMANKFLFDSYFRYGAENRQLKAGSDCPENATFMGNICIFEHNNNHPLWRKDDPGERFYAGAKGTALVVLAMFEVGNYDYSAYVHFRLDGQMDVGFGATGQLFMSWWQPESAPYGTRVQEEALANLHAHYAGFKVDLDVLGQNNCVEKEALVYMPRINKPEGMDTPPKDMMFIRTILNNEDEGKIRLDNMNPTNYKVVSCNEKNKWGYLRGWEVVHPNTPLAIYDHAGFTNYHTIFAQRKESEPYLTTEIDINHVAEPFYPIEGGISNSESLIDVDIVAWVSLGFYHLPRAEDNPVTNSVTSSFSIRPFNYYDENPSIDLGQTVQYRSGEQTQSVPKGNCVVDV